MPEDIPLARRRATRPAALAAVLAAGLAPLVAVPAAAAEIPPVVVNEVEVNDDWIELHNTGEAAVDLGGYVVKDDDDEHALPIAAGTVIDSGGFLVIHTNLDELGDAGFGIGKGDAGRLFAPDGTLVSALAFAAGTATSWGLCDGEIVETAAATPGAANACTLDAAEVVVINEVVTNGDTPDGIELMNTGNLPVDVAGLKLADADYPADQDHIHTLPAGSVIAPGGFLSIPGEGDLGFGLGKEDSAILFAADGETVIDRHDWTAHGNPSWGRCPDGVGEFVLTASATLGAANDCPAVAPSPVVINEVETNGDDTDWVELYNTGDADLDLSGFRFRDNDASRTPYALPAGSLLPAKGFFVIDQAQGADPGFDFGLGDGDEAWLFEPDGVTVVASASWGAHAKVTYGLCPDGVGSLQQTTVSTKGAPNDCETVVEEPVVDTTPWPGSPRTTPIDGEDWFGGDLSGVDYEAAGDGVLWLVENGNGLLFRVVPDGSGAWMRAAGWEGGAQLRYPDGGGIPDAEGVTVTGAGSAGGVYVATERNNEASGVSRPSILRYDAHAGGELVATHEWNLAADFPGLGANQGLEGVTWVPDSFLTAQGFVDQNTGQAYQPARYPGHGDGLFFIGVEGTAGVYAYALGSDGSFDRVAAVETGYELVADVQFDAATETLWVVCDEACEGRIGAFGIDETGAFAERVLYARPAEAANVANEGFAIGECVDGARATFYTDDNDTDGFSLRSGTLNCAAGGGDNGGGDNGGGDNGGGDNGGGDNGDGDNGDGTGTGGDNGNGGGGGVLLPAPTPVDESALTEQSRGTIDVRATLVAGDAFEIELDAAYAGQRMWVWLHSEPVLLGSAVVGADGTMRFEVPDDMPLGAHRLVVVDAAGEVVAWADVRVVAPGTAEVQRLARTGGEIGVLPVAGALAVLLGAGLVAGRRLRRA
ncbi:lamin tail domain-containing protein [Microbacterium sp. NPDC003461]